MSLTEFAQLTKIAPRTVGWDAQAHADIDKVEYGIRGNYFIATAAEAINAFELVSWSNFATDPNEVSKATIGTAGKECIGMALETVAAGASVPVLTKGWVRNTSGWAWTVEKNLFCSAASGGVIYDEDEATETNYIGGQFNTALIQRIGFATDTDRIWFDPQPLSSMIEPPLLSLGFDASGSLTKSWKDIGSGQFEQVLTYSGSGGPHKVVYSFALPDSFWKFADHSGLSAFFVAYKVTSGGQVDCSAIYDGRGGVNSSPAAVSGVSTSWTIFTVPMSDFAGGTMSPVGEFPVHVELEVSGSAAVELAIPASLRHVPNVRLAGV